MTPVTLRPRPATSTVATGRPSDAARTRRDRRERGHSAGVEPAKPVDERADGIAVRAVARLPDRRLPATGQTLPRSFAKRLAEEVVEEAAEHKLGPVSLHGVAHARSGRGIWIQS